MTVKTEGFVHPALAVFLQRRIRQDPKLTCDAVAARWQEVHGATSRGGSESQIDQWQRAPTRMSPSDAERLLDALDLRSEWENFSGSSQFMTEKSGVFGFWSRSKNYIHEMDLDDILHNGLSLLDILKQCVAIDHGLFAHYGSEDWAGDPADWEAIFRETPDTWRIFATDSGEVLAYWSWVNPKPDIFARACLGNYPESEITLSTLRPITDGPVNMYGPGMYVRADIDKFLKSQLGSKILFSFLYQVGRLERSGVEFSEICIPVCAEDGRRYAQGRFGLEAMPKSIGRTHAAKSGWKFIEDGERFLPCVYYAKLDSSIRARASMIIKDVLT